VVTGGEVVRFERRVHGPDLSPIFIGSEGVLGVVTAAVLRLHPAPPARAFTAFSFPTLEAGWTAMRDMFQRGLRPAVARLYDPFDSFIARRGSARGKRSAGGHGARMPGAGARALLRLVRSPRLLNDAIDALGATVLRGATLVLVFEGHAADAADDAARAAAIAAQHGARAVSYRQSPVFMAGAFSDTMEVAATWSRLGAVYEAVRGALGDTVFVMAHLSHAYPDGCSIYFTFAGSAPTPVEAAARYDATWRAALDAAVAAGGTLSHHHGVGRSKAPKLGAELGLGVDVVHAMRRLFDPHGVMNPGNLLPREGPSPAERRPPEAPPAEPAVDPVSQLAHVRGDATLAVVERALAAEGLTLALGDDAPPLAETTVAAWIAAGAPGAPDPWIDPVDHLVAGFTATLGSGAVLSVRPAPRRAVGPDLFSLFLGTGDRAGTITSAHLRARGGEPPRPLATRITRDPRLGETERHWIERALDAARDVG
jgi:alkyldihydroxyacetonephosphate synthase